MLLLPEFDKNCLVFLFSKVNANAISALLAALDIHPILNRLPVFLPNHKDHPETYKEKLNNFERIILAVSVFSSQLDDYRKAINQFRETFVGKEIVVLAGGPHPIGDPYSMLINGADFVCTGEGEVTLPEFINWFLGSKSEIEEVPGIAYLKDGKLVKTEKPKPINLDLYPPFSIKHNLYRPIEITRGCAWKCRFCQIRSRGGMGVRHRSPEIVAKFAKLIHDRFKEVGTDIRFISPNALSYGSEDGRNLRLDIVEEMLKRVREIVGERGKIFFGSFPSEVRPETITEESVQLLKKYSDSHRIIVGGQSGSRRILERSSRGHTPEETIRAVRLLLEHGFEVDVDIIFGLPGETEEDVMETIAHMEKLVEMGAKIHSHTFMPLVGTPFASAEPGKIHPKYRKVIAKLQGTRGLKGHHERQEKIAERLATRRRKERAKKRISDHN